MVTEVDIDVHSVMIFNWALSEKEMALVERYYQEEYFGQITLWRRLVRYLAKWWDK